MQTHSFWAQDGPGLPEGTREMGADKANTVRRLPVPRQGDWDWQMRAACRGIDTSNFSFLTGPEGAIKDLLKQFGVLAELEENSEMPVPIIKHTLATLLINEQGKIAWRADGSGWSPKEFVEKMRR